MASLIDVVSKEFIKPSSPTPHHLRYFKLSFLDQIAPPFYVPLIFFYKADQLFTHDPNCRISELLKQTLSNVLTHFYPLAGTFCGDGFTVDCNDIGVPYIETQVHKDLLHVLDAPNMDELKHFCLPDAPDNSLERNASLVSVQLNVFQCGGIAIGVKISHTISDTMSLVTFMKAWAANCRGDADLHRPAVGFEGLFPPKDLASFGVNPSLAIAKEKLTTKRVVFDKETLLKLKHSAASSPGSQVKDPTRMEAVSAFLWRHFIKASRSKKGSDSKKASAAIVAVNIRGRMDPVLSDCTFGNIWIRYVVSKPYLEGGIGYFDLVNELRKGKGTVDSNHVKSVVQSADSDYLQFLKESYESFEDEAMDLCIFSSWCNFPVNAVDFGWGKPAWVGTSTIPMKNFAVLMDSNGGGIEAWLNIPEEDAPAMPDGLDTVFVYQI